MPRGGARLITETSSMIPQSPSASTTTCLRPLRLVEALKASRLQSDLLSSDPAYMHRHSMCLRPLRLVQALKNRETTGYGLAENTPGLPVVIPNGVSPAEAVFTV
jgi:hypothetical protein